MKSTSIVLTKKNINQVMGRIKKFFNDDLGSNYVTWHNWDSGWNFKPLLDVRKRTYTPTKIELGNALKGIRLWWNSSNAYFINIGSRIRFQGNKILIQIPHNLISYKYLYIAFQHDKDVIRIPNIDIS